MPIRPLDQSERDLIFMLLIIGLAAGAIAFFHWLFDEWCQVVGVP